jgi:beta-phosphoglucomutase-like phosphatase (HAD superfamily)
LLDAIEFISARNGASDVSKLKPAPDLLVSAAKQLAVDTIRCVLVGDSASDMLAATSSGAKGIGFANKPGKEVKLSTAGAFSVVTRLEDVTSAILQQGMP